MKLNKRNVERCSSMKVGQSNDGHAMKMRVDKLTVVLDVKSGEQFSASLYKSLERIGKNDWKHYETEFVDIDKSLWSKIRYKKATKIYKDGRMLMHIGFEPYNKSNGGIRLDIRPQHMNTVRVGKLLSWLDARMKGEFLPLLKKAWVTHIDVALDLYGCSIDDYIWGVKNIKKEKHYNSRDGLPGVRLGSIRSQLHMQVYEKFDITGKTYKYREKGGYFDIDLGDHPKFLRIETRRHYDSKPGSKKNSMMLNKLKTMDNPFERLEVYSKHLDTHLIMDEFCREMPRSNTIKAWKEKINKASNTSRLSKRIEKIMKDKMIELFDKNELWKQWDSCLKRLGMLSK